MRYLLATTCMLLLAGCPTEDPLFCDIDTPCSAGHGFCDVEGVCPASNGHGNTCIPEPCWDAGPMPDAGASAIDADPNAPDAAVDAASGPPDASQPLDAGPGEWSQPAIVTGVVATGDERHPSVSDDELSLYFTRLINDGDIYVATRAATSLPFGMPTEVSVLNGIHEDDGPETSPSHLEMFFTETVAGPGNTPFLKQSTRISTAVSWSAPTYLSFAGVGASLSGDARAMYFIGPRPEDCTGSSPCLRKSTRASVGAEWSDPADVGFTPPADYYHIDISSDELSILVSSRELGATAQPQILVGTRSSTSAPFTSFTPLPQLEIGAYLWDASWNADETAIYFSADDDGQYRIYVSVLQ